MAKKRGKIKTRKESKTKKNPFKLNKYEIMYNIINSILAGSLVLLGSFATGKITAEGIFFALIASGIIAITKFKEYFDGERKEYTKIFQFVG